MQVPFQASAQKNRTVLVSIGVWGVERCGDRYRFEVFARFVLFFSHQNHDVARGKPVVRGCGHIRTAKVTNLILNENLVLNTCDSARRADA